MDLSSSSSFLYTPSPQVGEHRASSSTLWGYGGGYFAVLISIFSVLLLAPTQVCISLLSEHDGKGDIVEAAREFCWGIQAKQRALKEMEPDLLNSLLKGN